MNKKFLLLILLPLSFSFSQWKTISFPSELNVQPFTANFLEARTGAAYLFDLDKLRLDIGTSHDIVQLTSEKKTLSFGADFFTYTRLRKQNNFKFPVETIDYMFGINFGYKITEVNSRDFGFRLRISHISAHLVDGLYEADSTKWKNNRQPFVYSREFVELFPYYRISGFRTYIGFTYLFHTLPSDFKKIILQVGADYFIECLKTESFTPFVAYDLKLSGYSKYQATNTLNAGIKFGKPESRGFSLLFTYISGRNVHGELYDLNEHYFTFGFNLDI